MDRAERIRQSRQSVRQSSRQSSYQLEVGCVDRPMEQHSRQLEELGRLLVAAHSRLVHVNQHVQTEDAKLSALRAEAADLEQRSQAAHVRLRQFQALELASRAALQAYTAELTQVTRTLQLRKEALTSYSASQLASQWASTSTTLCDEQKV